MGKLLLALARSFTLLRVWSSKIWFFSDLFVLFGLLNGVTPVYIFSVLFVDVVTVPFG
jgi:hypothetical protein